jgi:hypothetical protein
MAGAMKRKVRACTNVPGTPSVSMAGVAAMQSLAAHQQCPADGTKDDDDQKHQK